MFGIFKKKRVVLTTSTRVDEVCKIVAAVSQENKISTLKFLNEYPKYSEIEELLLYELLWIPYVSAFMAIEVMSDFQTANSTIKPFVMHFTRPSAGVPFSEDERIESINRLNGYLVRFNRGIILRDSSNAKGEELMKILSQALFDCANEGIYYLTDKQRDPHKTAANSHLLEERVSYGTLEMHLREVMMKYFFQFLEHFKQFSFS